MHGRPQRRTGRLLGQRLAAVAILAVVGVGVYLVWPSQPLDSKTSCVYAGDSTSALNAFAALTGQQMDCAVLFNYSATGWDEWADPWFTHPSRDGTDWTPWIKADPAQRRIVLTQEMVPSHVPGNWRVLGARGAYDKYARQLAANLVAAGMGNAVIRLGHEMNTTQYHDGLGNNPAQYRDWATYWARVVRAMRSVPGAHFLFDWNVNAGYRNIPLASYYPGNDVVDVIGIDIYDSGMPGNPRSPATRWASLASEPGGLAEIVAFARARNKPLSFPEWGLVAAGSGGIGDDPAYVRAIADQVKDNPVVYQAYFDRPTGGVLPLQNAPGSLRVWREFFGPGGSIQSKPW